MPEDEDQFNGYREILVSLLSHRDCLPAAELILPGEGRESRSHAAQKIPSMVTALRRLLVVYWSSRAVVVARASLEPRRRP